MSAKNTDRVRNGMSPPVNVDLGRSIVPQKVLYNSRFEKGYSLSISRVRVARHLGAIARDAHDQLRMRALLCVSAASVLRTRAVPADFHERAAESFVT